MSSFRWGMVAWSTLTYDQMAYRYVLDTHVFSSLQSCCFPSCFCLSWAWLHQLPATFCDGTQSFVGREDATIHDMKDLIILILKTLIALRFKDKTGLFKANGPFKCLSPRIVKYLHKRGHTSAENKLQNDMWLWGISLSIKTNSKHRSPRQQKLISHFTH